MFKIGILGSDNSHALAFSKLTNIKDEKTGEYLYPDMRVTAIFGLDKQQTEKVAREGAIEYIANSPEEMIGRVDAVMVVFRHGDLHAKYALPFIEAGIPTWIDKPFTISVSDAKLLIDAANKHNTLLTGGSTCKYAYDVVMLKNSVERIKQKDESFIGAVNFPADMESEYGGIHFYGPHMAEMVMAIFGYDVKSVTTSVVNDSIVAVAKYDNFQVTMNFTKAATKYYGVIYSGTNTMVREIDISIIYRLGFDEFAKMLRTQKRPLELSKLLAPTVLLNAIDESINSGKEVYLHI